MARRYGSFLIRYWRLEDGQERVEVEHLQSGGRRRAGSLPAIVAWIAERLEDPTAPQEPQWNGVEVAPGPTIS
jgi:hypothetical protein